MAFVISYIASDSKRFVDEDEDDTGSNKRDAAEKRKAALKAEWAHLLR